MREGGTREPMSTSVRPTGVTILAVLAGIFGVLGLLGSLAIIGFGGVLGGAVGGTTGAVVGGFAVIGGIILLVASVIYLAFAYGAWMLKPWGWMLGLIGAGLSGLSNLLSLTGGIAAGNIVGLAIAGVIIYYLMTPPVKAAFGRP